MVTAPGATREFGHVTRASGFRLSFVFRGEMACCPIIPPRTYNDFMLPTHYTASKSRCLTVVTGALRSGCEALGNGRLADFVVAVGYAPQTWLPAEEKDMRSVRASRSAMTLLPMSRILQGLEHMLTSGFTVDAIDSGARVDYLRKVGISNQRRCSKQVTSVRAEAHSGSISLP
jgi:hypothetical protein